MVISMETTTETPMASTMALWSGTAKVSHLGVPWDSLKGLSSDPSSDLTSASSSVSHWALLWAGLKDGPKADHLVPSLQHSPCNQPHTTLPHT